MRWKDTLIGETRIRSGFLLFPKWIDGETRWLEYATWREQFNMRCMDFPAWEAVEWLTREALAPTEKEVEP